MDKTITFFMVEMTNQNDYTPLEKSRLAKINTTD